MVEAVSITGVSIYPNPVQDVLSVRSNVLYKNAQLRISNAAGQNVVQQVLNGAGSFTVQVASLPPGVYYGKIIGDDTPTRFKFIKD
jgi:hypothetical protein